LNRIPLFLGWLTLTIFHPSTGQSGDGLSVKEAVQLALTNNPEILSGAKEIDAAIGRSLQAGRIQNPELQFNWNEIPTSFNIGKAEESGIGIVQTIEFPTKRSNRIDVAAFDKQIAELRLERLKTLVRAKVTQGYYSLLFREEVVSNLRKLEALLRNFLHLATSRLESGSDNYMDVLRAKVELARLGNDIVDAQRERSAQRIHLNILLGEDPQRSFVLTDSLLHTPIGMETKPVVERLLSQSATLQLADQMVRRQKSEVSLAQSSYLPDLTVGLFRERLEGEPPYNANQFTGTTSTSFGIEVGISFPLWFWQEPRGLVEEASASVSIATLNAGAIHRRVRAEIINALEELSSAEAQVDVFDTVLLSDVDDILETGIAQYRNNSIDALHLVDLYRMQREARMEYARALLHVAHAAAGLQAAAELEHQ